MMTLSITKWIRFTQRFWFLSSIISCLEQLKTIQQTEKKKKCPSFLAICIMSLTALCYTILKWNLSFTVHFLVRIRFPVSNIWCLLISIFWSTWNDSPRNKRLMLIRRYFGGSELLLGLLCWFHLTSELRLVSPM